MSWLAVLFLFAPMLHSTTATLPPRQLANGTTESPSGPLTTGSLSPDEFATSCNKAKISWITGPESTFVSNTTYVTTGTFSFTDFTKVYITTTSLRDDRTYTLCDGYPRLDGSTSVTETNVPNATSYSTSTVTITSAVYSLIPPPPCVIPSKQCSSMQSVYNSSKSVYDSALSSYEYQKPHPTKPYSGVPQPTPVVCGVPPTRSVSLGPPSCGEAVLSMRLLYWPVTTTSGDLCKGDGMTVTPTPTIPGLPDTTVYRNKTLTSPTVYMEFFHLQVGADYGVPTTVTGTSSIVGFLPDAVSSLCAGPNGTFTTRSIDYADFNSPVPADAYRCQPKCYSGSTGLENQCSTIYDDFNPALAVPSQFFSIFSSPGVGTGSIACEFVTGDTKYLPYFYDPPTAIIAAATLLPTSTSNTIATTTAATPSMSISPTTPTPTSIPTPDPNSVPNKPESHTDSSLISASSDPAQESPTTTPSSAIVSQANDPPAQSTSSAPVNIGSIIVSIIDGQSLSSSQDPADATSTSAQSSQKVGSAPVSSNIVLPMSSLSTGTGTQTNQPSETAVESASVSPVSSSLPGIVTSAQGALPSQGAPSSQRASSAQEGSSSVVSPQSSATPTTGLGAPSTSISPSKNSAASLSLTMSVVGMSMVIACVLVL